MTPFKNCSQSPQWPHLQNHAHRLNDLPLQKLLTDENRFEAFSTEGAGIFLDYSKNRVDADAMHALIALARDCNLENAIEAMFSGEKINTTEDRAVLHTALRAQDETPVYVDGVNVVPDIVKVRKQLASFCHRVIKGKWRGEGGKKITTVVNIGIGGSDLGPRMAMTALGHYQIGPDIRFVSNIDPSDLATQLKGLYPAETLFIIASKTFTTQETLANAHAAKQWIINNLGHEATAKHFVALTTNIDAAVTFGIAQENCFGFWDFVGGRYSVWSAIGLSLALGIGNEDHADFLRGANAMDQHFRNTPLATNIPVILGVLGIWYNNFFNCDSHAVLPYSSYLKLLPAYLQQADMESNGKGVDKQGQKLNYQSGPIIWGQAGTDGQHAFYQSIHQGTKVIPCDFIGFKHALNPESDHHDILMSHMFAQTQALAIGLDETEVRRKMAAEGLDQQHIDALAAHRTFPGNRPSNTLLIDTLTPRSLGALIAMYEHKIFVQGVLWNVNSFDQWGVELGKVLAKNLLGDIKSKTSHGHDASTNGLLNRYFQR